MARRRSQPKKDLLPANITFDDVNVGTNAFSAHAEDTVTVNGTISTTGAGSIAISADQNVVVAAPGSLTSVDGNITVTANQEAVAASGDFDGIELTNAVITTANGDILLRAKGGTTVANYGIRSTDGSISSTGTGTITLDGEGVAPSSGIGTWVSTPISTLDGNVLIQGSDSTNHGLQLHRANLTATGNAEIRLDGAAGNSSGANGVMFSSSTQTVTTNNGDIVLIGTSDGLHGVMLNTSRTISVTGSGNIQIDGSGGARFGVGATGSDVSTTTGAISITGDGTETGIRWQGNSAITSNSGAVSLTTPRNISMEIGSSIGTTDGDITINANQQPVATTGSFDGYYQQGSITSVEGDIEINAKSGNSNGNRGMWFESGASILSTGTGADAATITLRGVSLAPSSGYGVRIPPSGNTNFSSIDGDIVVNGVAEGGNGIELNRGLIASTGTTADAALISIDGTSNVAGHGRRDGWLF